MKIALSNLAWQPPDNDTAFRMMKEEGISGIELAPTKFFPDLSLVSPQQADDLKLKLAGLGLETVAFQSLLFGRPDLKVFSDPTTVGNTIDYLERIGWLAAVLGAKILVFGSPKNRLVPDDMSRDDSWKAATDFFWKVGQRLEKYGVILGLEPNPVAYGGNFATSADKASRVVRAVDSPYIRLHLDLGAMVLDGEDINRTIEDNADILAHFHVSEPNIKPINADNPNHQVAAAALRRINYDKWVSVEMLPPHEGVEGLRQVLRFVKQTYG